MVNSVLVYFLTSSPAPLFLKYIFSGYSIFFHFSTLTFLFYSSLAFIVGISLASLKGLSLSCDVSGKNFSLVFLLLRNHFSLESVD